jgi:hypothetical protein
MAVALAGTQGQDNGTSQNPTFNFTPSSAPTGVGVGVVWKDEDANVTITSVTYGGNAMTLEDSQAFQSNKMKAALYSLGNPPSGLQAVQVNFSAAPDRESCHCVVAVTGGDTSDVFGTPVKATGVSAFPTVSGIASSPNEWCMDIAGASNTGAMGTVSAGQTERMDVALASAAGGCSTEAGNTTVNMGWTLSGSTDWGIIGASFKVAGAGGTGKTFYLRTTAVDSWMRLSESGESTVTLTSGWTVGTGSTNHSSLETGVKRLESTFTDTTQPDGSLNATLFDAWRTEDKYTGDFASGNWTVSAWLRSALSPDQHDGAIVVRLFRGANANGSGAVQITSAQQVGSTATNMTGNPNLTELIWNPGAFSVANEYLFFQIAWKRIGAGAAADTDILFKSGGGGFGTTITTANFTNTSTVERSAAFFHAHVAAFGGITNV